MLLRPRYLISLATMDSLMSRGGGLGQYHSVPSRFLGAIERRVGGGDERIDPGWPIHMHRRHAHGHSHPFVAPQENRRPLAEFLADAPGDSGGFFAGGAGQEQDELIAAVSGGYVHLTLPTI